MCSLVGRLKKMEGRRQKKKKKKKKKAERRRRDCHVRGTSIVPKDLQKRRRQK